MRTITKTSTNPPTTSPPPSPTTSPGAGFDFRRKGEPLEDGYQSPPVNWGLSSPRKRAFFSYLSEITGPKAP
jgi:hypothetical protein